MKICIFASSNERCQKWNNFPTVLIRWFSCDKPTLALAGRRMTKFKNNYGNIDWLMIGV